MKPNALKLALRAGGLVRGIFIDIPSPQIVEMAGISGFDFAIIDAEHTAIGVAEEEHLVRAAEVRGLSTMTRIAANSEPSILRHADTGTQSILVPLIETASDVLSAIQSIKYPPEGARGLAHVRASDYGIPMPL